MKKGGETFKHMVGKRVLPASFSVYFDPTQNYYGKQALKNMGAKTSMRKVNPLPEEDLQIPEMLELPASEYIEESGVTRQVRSSGINEE